MTPPFPQTINEMAFAVFGVIGIGFVILSLWISQRAYSIRMTGIFFLLGVAAIANSGWTYFATVFIIGTLVTELEFLQNIAAIVRGDKSYFEYLKATRGQVPVKQAQLSETGGPEPAIDAMEYKILQTLWTKQVNKLPEKAIFWLMMF